MYGDWSEKDRSGRYVAEFSCAAARLSNDTQIATKSILDVLVSRPALPSLVRATQEPRVDQGFGDFEQTLRD